MTGSGYMTTEGSNHYSAVEDLVREGKLEEAKDYIKKMKMGYKEVFKKKTK